MNNKALVDEYGTPCALDTLNFQQMTPEQRASVCETCGVAVSRHVDGWDGWWIGCEEVKRRYGKYDR